MEAVLTQCVTNVQRYSIHGGVLPFRQLADGKYDALGMPCVCHGNPQLSDDGVAGIVLVCKETSMDV